MTEEEKWQTQKENWICYTTALLVSGWFSGTTLLLHSRFQASALHFLLD